MKDGSVTSLSKMPNTGKFALARLFYWPSWWTGAISFHCVFHSLACACVLVGDEVDTAVHTIRLLDPKDGKWKNEVEEPVLKLATKTFPTVCVAYGMFVVTFIGEFWSVGFVAILNFARFQDPTTALLGCFAYLAPLYCFWSLAHLSSKCDGLHEALNTKRLNNLNDGANIEQLERALERLNKGKGIGFVVFGYVLDIPTMKRVLSLLVSGLVAGLPFALSLAPSNGDGVCELTRTQADTIRAVMMGHNKSCTYDNITLSDIIQNGPLD